MAGWTHIIPLVILFIVVGVGAFVVYSLYQWSGELTDRANKKMETKNLKFSREGGLRVGVKEIKDENYADKTQNVLVNVWNNAAFPNYKSRLGWNKTQGGAAPSIAHPESRSSSSSSSRVSSSQPSQQQPRQQLQSRKSGVASTKLNSGAADIGRSASPVPGRW